MGLLIFGMDNDDPSDEPLMYENRIGKIEGEYQRCHITIYIQMI